MVERSLREQCPADICGDVLPGFLSSPEKARLVPLSGGLINDTYRVEGEGDPWVLQRLNAAVFPDPPGVMANLRLLLDHVQRNPCGDSGLALPAIRPTRTGADYLFDHTGALWRGLALIPRARNIQSIHKREEAIEVGRALGWFHRLTETLSPGEMIDTLPGFHVTPLYLAQWDEALGELDIDVSLIADHGDFIEERRAGASILEAARDEGVLVSRVIHGDPKLDNVLFSQAEIRAVSLIDLDTVKPGLIHYDLGDCLRSCCNTAGETDGATVNFEVGIFESVLKGYFAEATHSLTEDDLDHIYSATWLLPYELGLRFLTDHVRGDRYFKVKHRGQNLKRASRQFDLVRAIERQKDQLESIVAYTWAQVQRS